MPIHMPQCVGKLFRPSNGTEGEMFMEQYCYSCIHDKYPDEPYCDIIADTYNYSLSHPMYPKEWVFGEDGYPECTKFESDAEGKE